MFAYIRKYRIGLIMNVKTDSAKTKIVKFILKKHNTSKAELAKQLNLSMPTVLGNVAQLMKENLLVENGEYQSTGGRKAKSIGINEDYGYALGVNITKHHISLVLINLNGVIIKSQRENLVFSDNEAYLKKLAERILSFIKESQLEERLLGIGLSIPGIVDKNKLEIRISHILNTEHFSLLPLQKMLSFPILIENDANADILAESLEDDDSAMLLALNDTLGGSCIINGELFRGDQQKASEFGHMILMPKGKMCYCGKEGCADAYLAAKSLLDENTPTLEAFFGKVRTGDINAKEKLDRYLDNLAILITNLRMAADMDMILGGKVGLYLPDYNKELLEKIQFYDGFEKEIGYVRNCKFIKEASAVGIASQFFQVLAENI